MMHTVVLRRSLFHIFVRDALVRRSLFHVLVRDVLLRRSLFHVLVRDVLLRRSLHPLRCVSNSLCPFARLPLEIWRWLVGLLSYSDVAACSCVAPIGSDVGLLFKCGCCVSTFKRLLVEYGAITWIADDAGPEYGTVQWDLDFWSESEERKHFWRRAIEIIFLYEPEWLQKGQRCDELIQQDYIHSCGVLFASDTCDSIHRKLQRQFRLDYVAPNHLVQPWFPAYYYPRQFLESDHDYFLLVAVESIRVLLR